MMCWRKKERMNSKAQRSSAFMLRTPERWSCRQHRLLRKQIWNYAICTLLVQVLKTCSLIFTPLIFTGCTYYPWGALDSIRWFQIITLFNPLTYAAEGLRFAMVPSFYGHALSTLAMPWIILGLSVTIVVFCIFGIRTFRRRVVM